jgi:hypothetical protein
MIAPLEGLEEQGFGPVGPETHAFNDVGWRMQPFSDPMDPLKTSRKHFSLGWCHRSNQNQPLKVELNQPLTFQPTNEHCLSKKLHSRALREFLGKTMRNLARVSGWFNSTLAGWIQVTADTGCILRNLDQDGGAGQLNSGNGCWRVSTKVN